MTSKEKEPKGKPKARISEQIPSANWLALQKKISRNSKAILKAPRRKRQKTESVKDDGLSDASSSSRDHTSSSSFPRGHDPQPSHIPGTFETVKANVAHGRESVDHLRRMVFGQIEYTEEQRDPGKYLAVDCEMVGVGPEGLESSLARVSLVNYHGAVILDEFVRQREHVADYRTFVSGIRAKDMENAIPFQQVQKRVADLIEDRILVGHAVHNDLRALLLSQPRPLLRDTQLCAGKARLLKTKYPALRKLALQELGITIQAGEHSSVTDARATMALYRLHRKEWDKAFRTVPTLTTSKRSLEKRKAPADDNEEIDTEDTSQEHVFFSASASSKSSQKRKRKGEITGGGQRGISSGLSTVVKRGAETIKTGKLAPGASANEGMVKKDWWSTLSGDISSTSGQKGSKGSMRVSM